MKKKYIIPLIVLFSGLWSIMNLFVGLKITSTIMQSVSPLHKTYEYEIDSTKTIYAKGPIFSFTSDISISIPYIQDGKQKRITLTTDNIEIGSIPKVIKYFSNDKIINYYDYKVVLPSNTQIVIYAGAQRYIRTIEEIKDLQNDIDEYYDYKKTFN